MAHTKQLKACHLLLTAFRTGKLGQTVMPEDSNPWKIEQYEGTPNTTINDLESRIAYFTLPMALNDKRGSLAVEGSAEDME
jgi:hypothetical protein